MLGNIGQLASLVKNAGQIKQNVEQMNARMAAARFVGEAGGGQVRATVDGRGEVVSLKLEPALVNGGDVELIEDLTCAALRDAIARSREALGKEMQSLLPGMDLGGLAGLMGGGPK